MKNLIGTLAIILIVLAGFYFLVGDTENTNTPDAMVGGEGSVIVTPISHATMALAWAGETIYTDPVGGVEVFSGVEAPSLILVTDIHGDHLHVETLEAVVTPETIIVAPQAVADNLTDALLGQTVVIANGETTTQKGFSIEAVPMYNLPDQGVEIRHEKGRGNGYVVEREGERVYIAGDTADVPEMRALTNIDLAFVPMNLPFTMDVERAADAVLEFVPKTVYPYHYRGQDGLSDIEKFKSLVTAGNPDINVVLLDWYPEAPATAAEGEIVEADVVIDVSGKNFEFDVKEITVKEGDTVTINFISEQGFHDWVVDEFKAATERVRDGGTTSVTFVADAKGTYEYYCSVGEHRAMGMIGTLTVE